MIDPMTQRWQLKFGDHVFGPYEQRELEALLADGRLERSSLVAPEGAAGSWRPAGEVPELAGLFAGAPAGKARPPRIVGDPASDATMLHVTYALCAASLLTGLSAIAGLILAYVKRGEVPRWQASHYRWLIRTLWIWLLLMAIGGLTSPLGIGWLIIVAVSIWLTWRVAKGWLLVGQLRAIRDPTAWL